MFFNRNNQNDDVDYDEPNENEAPRTYGFNPQADTSSFAAGTTYFCAKR